MKYLCFLAVVICCFFGSQAKSSSMIDDPGNATAGLVTELKHRDFILQGVPSSIRVLLVNWANTLENNQTHSIEMTALALEIFENFLVKKPLSANWYGHYFRESYQLAIASTGKIPEINNLVQSAQIQEAIVEALQGNLKFSTSFDYATLIFTHLRREFPNEEALIKYLYFSTRNKIIVDIINHKNARTNCNVAFNFSLKAIDEVVQVPDLKKSLIKSMSDFLFPRNR